MPKISILLPIKNGAIYLHTCLNSIINQTFKDFELLIFDDNSWDKTLEIAEYYQNEDPRIKVYSGKEGFTANLNKGIEVSTGKYIARMDADDIMYPKRLEVQLKRMETLNIDVCGSWLKMFGNYTKTYIKTYDLEGIIKNPMAELAKKNCIAHPSVMVRKEFLNKHFLRYENYPFTEDYKLWFEIAKRKGVFYVEPQPLLSYRVSSAQVSIANEAAMEIAAAKVQEEIKKYMKDNNLYDA